MKSFSKLDLNHKRHQRFYSKVRVMIGIAQYRAWNSHSSITNIKNLIKKHNSNIMSKNIRNMTCQCGCRIRGNCPLKGKCVHQYIVAEVTSHNTCKVYYGTSEVKFKCRYNNSLQSFRYISHINDPELLK